VKKPLKKVRPARKRRRRVLEEHAAEESRSSKLHAKSLEVYAKHLASISEAVLHAVLRALATAQAVGEVNSVLETRFGMQDVMIDARQVQAAALEVLQAEIGEALARKSKLSARSRRELVDRLVARLIPTRDGAPAPSPYPVRPPKDNTVENVERLMQRELRRSFPPRDKQRPPPKPTPKPLKRVVDK